MATQLTRRVTPALRVLLDAVHRRHTSLRPLLLAAPTTRCGITLLQQAINQSGEAVIYGENFLMLEQLPYQLGSILCELEAKVRATEQTMEAFRADPSVEATRLYPDYLSYAYTQLTQYFGILEHYQNHASTLGRRAWGIKHPIRHSGSFQNFLSFLPEFRLVCLLRDPITVVQAMKARHPTLVRGAEACALEATRWVEHAEYLEQCRWAKLVVRYEDLLNDPDTWCALIEGHVGVPVDRALFHRTAEETEPYPALDKDELYAVRRISAETAERFGYEVLVGPSSAFQWV